MGLFSKKKEDASPKMRPTVTVVNNLNKKTRAFYRAFILPQHIAKRDGELKTAFQEELAGHLADIKEYGLEEEFKQYAQAQRDRQAAYDEWQAARTQLASTRGELGDKELRDLIDRVSLLEDQFMRIREAFKAQYH